MKLFRRKAEKIRDTYVVLFQADGTNYYMDWPAYDIDPTSITYGQPIPVSEVVPWVWAWIDQEADANGGRVMLGADHREARSVKAASISFVDVVNHNFWMLP